ncbi:hypothetical protein BLNAU_1468 [Blattamonas nauphoetae]|uniref:Uncharacterized protein n=1 Tax=Blattamonas nauphoetae TaxID=2049346 RepID=A0ABQ9YIE4_9EUKA|nr:hypothetical protein BLNAU_1468 [Blattamonas nauphoetae]
MDCSAFLNWDECRLESDQEISVVFRSLVATLKFQAALDASLEEKAVKFLEFVKPKGRHTADAFLSTLPSSSDESVPDFVQCIVVLVSTPSQAITAAAMDLLSTLIDWFSPQVRLALVKADLIPELITTLNPQYLSFTEAVVIHTNLIYTITNSLWLTTPDCLTRLKIEDANEQQAVHETVFQQVLTPSEKYIWHLCVNRFSIIEREQSRSFLVLLALIFQICPYYQRTMDIILHMPVFLTVPSCLTFFEAESQIWLFLNRMVDVQLEWNKTMGEGRQIWKDVHLMLRMEGIEDVIVAKLQNDKNTWFGGSIIEQSIRWNNLLDSNILRRR